MIGEYGSGKTFFLHLVRLIALEKGLVVLSADLAPDRRIHATGGQARSLYAELARNASTRTKPEGGALTSVVERFVTQAVREADASEQTTDAMIRGKLEHLEELTGGYEFATVIAKYWEGHETGDDELKSNVLRWLRAEFATRTDARKALGVRTIIDDSSVYDHLKLMSAFVREAGYGGFLLAPWTGTVGTASLAIVLTCLGFSVSTFDGILEVSLTRLRSERLVSELKSIAADSIDLSDLIRNRASALIFEKFHFCLGDDLLLSDALSRRLDLKAVPQIAQRLCSQL